MKTYTLTDYFNNTIAVIKAKNWDSAINQANEIDAKIKNRYVRVAKIVGAKQTFIM